jgi:hypothetical protein
MLIKKKGLIVRGGEFDIWKCNLINTEESYSCFIFVVYFVLENISFKCVIVLKSPSTSNNFFNHDLSRKLVSTATEQVKMRPKLAHNDVEHKKWQNISWHNMTSFKKSLFYIILECTRTYEHFENQEISGFGKSN